MRGEVQDRIEQLIYRTNEFLKMAESLGNLYIKRKKKIINTFNILNSSRKNMMVIHQNLYFYEVLLILKTLFESRKKPNEISFEYLFTINETSDYEDEYQRIKALYRASSLSEIRNKLIAHKDIERSGDPFAAFINPIHEVHLNSAREVVNMLIEFNKKFNPDPTSYLLIYYEDFKETLLQYFTNYFDDQK